MAGKEAMGKGKSMGAERTRDAKGRFVGGTKKAAAKPGAAKKETKKAGWSGISWG